MRQIGHIARLQVQTAPLKQGTRPNQYYDPTALSVASELQLSEYGVKGLVDGAALIDLHHAHHPESRQSGGKNGISFNFTSHCAAMEARFGPHMTIGSAGENIIIACDQTVALSELGEAIFIVNNAGDAVRLGQLMVAAPCEPFSRFALEMEPGAARERMKETLQFLSEGMRGFYCKLDGAPVSIAVDDSVYLA